MPRQVTRSTGTRASLAANPPGRAGNGPSAGGQNKKRSSRPLELSAGTLVPSIPSLPSTLIPSTFLLNTFLIPVSYLILILILNGIREALPWALPQASAPSNCSDFCMCARSWRSPLRPTRPAPPRFAYAWALRQALRQALPQASFGFRISAFGFINPTAIARRHRLTRSLTPKTR